MAIATQTTLSTTDIDIQHSASLQIPKANASKHIEIKSSQGLHPFNNNNSNNNISYLTNSYQILSNSPKTKNMLSATLNSYQNSSISSHVKKAASVVKTIDSMNVKGLKRNESNANTNTNGSKILENNIPITTTTTTSATSTLATITNITTNSITNSSVNLVTTNSTINIPFNNNNKLIQNNINEADTISNNCRKDLKNSFSINTNTNANINMNTSTTTTNTNVNINNNFSNANVNTNNTNDTTHTNTKISTNNNFNANTKINTNNNINENSKINTNTNANTKINNNNININTKFNINANSNINTNTINNSKKSILLNSSTIPKHTFKNISNNNDFVSSPSTTLAVSAIVHDKANFENYNKKPMNKMVDDERNSLSWVKKSQLPLQFGNTDHSINKSFNTKEELKNVLNKEDKIDTKKMTFHRKVNSENESLSQKTMNSKRMNEIFDEKRKEEMGKRIEENKDKKSDRVNQNYNNDNVEKEKINEENISKIGENQKENGVLLNKINEKNEVLEEKIENNVIIDKENVKTGNLLDNSKIQYNNKSIKGGNSIITNTTPITKLSINSNQMNEYENPMALKINENVEKTSILPKNSVTSSKAENTQTSTTPAPVSPTTTEITPAVMSKTIEKIPKAVENVTESVKTTMIQETENSTEMNSSSKITEASSQQLPTINTNVCVSNNALQKPKRKCVKFSGENEECPFRKVEAPTVLKSSPIFLVNSLVKPFLETRVSFSSLAEFKQGMIIRKPIIIEKAGLLIEEKEKSINQSNFFKSTDIKKEHGVFKARPSHVPYGLSSLNSMLSSSSSPTSINFINSPPEKDKVRIVMQVQNLAFHKEVYVRYTFNNWVTSKDIKATYYNSLTVTSYINKRYHESTSISPLQSNLEKIKNGIDDRESKVVVKEVDRFVADIEIPSYINDFIAYEGNSFTNNDSMGNNFGLNTNTGNRSDRRRYSQSLGEEWDNDIINKCTIKFAVYYRVNGQEYWESNNNLNYTMDIQRVIYIPTKKVYTRSTSMNFYQYKEMAAKKNIKVNLPSILKKKTENNEKGNELVVKSDNQIISENREKYILESIKKDLLNSTIFQKSVDPTVINTIINSKIIGKKINIKMMMMHYQKKACIIPENENIRSNFNKKENANYNDENRRNTVISNKSSDLKNLVNNNRNYCNINESSKVNTIRKGNNIDSHLNNQNQFKYGSRSMNNNPLGISIK